MEAASIEVASVEDSVLSAGVGMQVHGRELFTTAGSVTGTTAALASNINVAGFGFASMSPSPRASIAETRQGLGFRV
jgi:hypothetical protein